MLKNTTTNSSLVIIPFVLCLFIPRRNVIKPHVVVLRVVKCCCCLLVTSGLAPWFLGLHANSSNHLLGHGSIINLLIKLFSSNWPYCINNVFFLKDKSTNFKHQNLSTGIGEYHCMCCWSCTWWEAGGWLCRYYNFFAYTPNGSWKHQAFLEGVPSGDCIVLLGDFDAHVGNDGET